MPRSYDCVLLIPVLAAFSLGAGAQTPPADSARNLSPRDSARVLAPVTVTVKTDRILETVGFTSRREHGAGRYITGDETRAGAF